MFSAVLGDNILYRLAVYVFVGMSAGYAAIVTWNSVLVPWIRATLLSGEPLRVALGVIPLALGRAAAVQGECPPEPARGTHNGAADRRGRSGRADRRSQRHARAVSVRRDASRP
ncbi:MAG: hypothetical protein HND48_05705 [Chloroflexi bacterium]|nr:hypothetical protein [Chloroflexota bacterium]